MPLNNKFRTSERLVLAGDLFEEAHDFREFEARIAALPTERDRGDAFDVFANAYLAARQNR